MEDFRHKLIEDWLPLGAIASAMSRRRTRGETSGIHPWWGTRSAALARAVLFAQLVDSPEDGDVHAWNRLRDAIYGLLCEGEMLRDWWEDFVRKSCPDGLPSFFDPFAGTGTFPYEAGRLGLGVTASDLNPVACLLSRAALMTDKQAATVEVAARNLVGTECRDAVNALYGGADACLWSYAVPDPNPAFGGALVPLSVSFALSKTKWLKPVVENGSWRYEICEGPVPAEYAQGTRIAPSTFKSILSGATITKEYIREMGEAGRLARIMTAVLRIDVHGKKQYALPTDEDRARAEVEPCDFSFDTEYPDYARWFTPVLYGGKTFESLHLPRQKKVLALIAAKIAADGGSVEAATIRALALSQLASWMTVSCSWHAEGELARNLFVHQCIPMAWDFCEYNPFGRHTKNWDAILKGVIASLRALPGKVSGKVFACDARDFALPEKAVISTEVPYYDLVATADLSDFYYHWLKRALGGKIPELFTGLSTPKAEELTALTYRRGGREGADEYYRKSLAEVVANIARNAREDFPVTLWYSFKSAKLDGRDGVPFRAMVEAIVAAGMQITATWPICDARKISIFGKKNDEVFSAIIFVCRRSASARPTTTRKLFLAELRSVLPDEVRRLRDLLGVKGPEFASAAVGRGLRHYTQYAKVLSADGSCFGVDEAVGEILKIVREIEAIERAETAEDVRRDWRTEAMGRLTSGDAAEKVRAWVSSMHEKASAEGRLADVQTLNDILNEWNNLIEESKQ